MNRAILTGRLTRNPELSETAGGRKVARFSIAVNRNYKDADGEYPVDFFNCVTWNASATFLEKYCHKGDKVLVEGSVENREYTDKNGEVKKVTEIQVQSVENLTPKAAADPAPKPDTQKPRERLQSFDDDGDIPF